MTTRRWPPKNRWVLLAAILVHCTGVVALYFVLSRVGLPAAMVSGLVGLALLKHIGMPVLLLGPLYAWFRRAGRRPRPTEPEDDGAGPVSSAEP